MKLRKIINKRMIIISSVLMATMLILTGCGKADINIKMYDKENESAVSNIAKEDDTNSNKNEVSQEKESEEKSEKNTQKSGTTQLREVLSRDWLEGVPSSEKKDKKVHFKKISIYEKDLYVVVIEDGGSHNTMYLVAKKDNEYVVKKVLENEQSDILFDMSNQNMFVVESTTELYAIGADDLTVEKFASSAINPNDGEEYWYVNGKNVSYGRYYSYFDKDNLKSVATWSLLTKENIDKIEE